MIRKMVKIDEEKCNGCGLCVPSCAEGAIQIIDGKARLIADNLCDGLGACLGDCPLDAITIEEREADEFDEAAVEKILQLKQRPVEKGLILVASRVEQIGALLPATGQWALDEQVRQQLCAHSIVL